MFEGPASIRARLVVEQVSDVVNLTIRPDDKLALVDEVDLHSIANRWRIPNERQLVARFNIKALWPSLHRHKNRAALAIDESLLCRCHWPV